MTANLLVQLEAKDAGDKQIVYIKRTTILSKLPIDTIYCIRWQTPRFVWKRLNEDGNIEILPWNKYKTVWDDDVLWTGYDGDWYSFGLRRKDITAGEKDIDVPIGELARPPDGKIEMDYRFWLQRHVEGCIWEHVPLTKIA